MLTKNGTSAWVRASLAPCTGTELWAETGPETVRLTLSPPSPSGSAILIVPVIWPPGATVVALIWRLEMVGAVPDPPPQAINQSTHTTLLTRFMETSSRCP